jgi:hypothetical protein
MRRLKLRLRGLLVGALSLTACGQSDTPKAHDTIESQSPGSYAAELATALTIPLSGDAAWRHFYDDREQGHGLVTTDFAAAFGGSSGAQATIDVTTSAGPFERQFLSASGLQPASDAFLSPFAVMLDMLPNRYATPQPGQTWSSAFPQAWLDKISAAGAAGVPDTHLEREVSIKDVFPIQSGALNVVRVTFAEYSTVSPTEQQMEKGAQPGRQMRTALGVADILVGVTGPFAGRMLPVRIASVSRYPIANIADDTTYEAVLAGPHTSDIDCATSLSQVAAASLALVPTGGEVAPPSDYALCASALRLN